VVNGQKTNSNHSRPVAIGQSRAGERGRMQYNFDSLS
jgi:hypothetical protein